MSRRNSPKRTSRTNRPIPHSRAQHATRPENIPTAITNRKARAAQKQRRAAADRILMADATRQAEAHARILERRRRLEAAELENRRNQI